MTGPPPAATYIEAGPDRAPTIVFVHGTRLTRASWHAQLDALSDTYRVIAMDLPGHGSLADRPFTLAGGADELARVIETAGAGRAVVVGLSLGGYVAMDLASKRPELVRGLVLSGATQDPVGVRAVPYRALAWVMGRFDGPAFDGVNTWFFRTRYPAAVADPILADGFYADGGAEALRTLIGQEFSPRLAAYDGPVMILNGELDLLFRMGANRFARQARDVRRVRIRGATHLANLDRPEAFNAAVRRFVGDLADRA